MHIFFTDLDGTLLNSDSAVSERTQKAIAAYTAAGHKFVIASGRAVSSIQGVLTRAGLDYSHSLIVAHNGSQVLDCESGKNIHDLRMKKEDALEIMRIADELGIHNQTYNEKGILTHWNGPELALYLSRAQMPYTVTDDIAGELPEDPFKVVTIDLKRPEALAELANRTKDLIAGKYISTYSFADYLEFIHKDSGKGVAVKAVCDYYGISTEDAYAAGDAENDLTMLREVGNSIAMCNGSDEVKSIARFITDFDNNHDGLAPILEKLAQDPA